MKTSRGRLALLFLASLVVGTLGHYALLRATHRGRVLPGVTVLGTPLSGLSGNELRKAVEGLAPKVARLAGSVSVREKTFPVTAATTGASLDVDATVGHALVAGRDGSFVGNLGAFLRRALSPESLPVRVRLSPDVTETLLAGFERTALGDPAVEGTVGYSGRVFPTYPKPGLAVPRAEARELLARALTASRTTVVLPVITETPKLEKGDVDRAVERGAALVSAPVTFRKAEGGELVFSPADLGLALRSRLSLTPAPHLELFFDREALLTVLGRERSRFERPARNAAFETNARHEITIVPSEIGTRIDDEAVLGSVLRLASGAERTGELPFLADVVPKLTTEQAEALHVKALVSSFTTYFPCCEARVKNIERMATLVDGTVVAPGETYSINEHAGARSAANGFVAGPTIVEGEMEMTVGGGVSQFATTLFNAVFDAGYEVIQRQAHTYYFPRYPEGHDATLGYPLPDLVFRNDSQAGLVIRASTGKTFVKVELYGDNGGRRVERHVSSRFDITKPDVVYEPNDELRPDEEKVKYGGQLGWSVNVSRVVTFPDGTKKEERRKVTYSARSRRVEVHSCKIPEGSPGYTGDRCPKVEPPDGGSAP
ncbi:MAG TPA: VanW family protein [Polyangiaceae bacterium]|nr:VanW family protein [Polyangiaceae bacterium]